MNFAGDGKAGVADLLLEFYNWLPSGKPTKKRTGKIHHAINGKIHITMENPL